MTPAIEVGPVGVVDDEHLGVERAHLAVERGDLLAVLGAAHDEPPPATRSRSKACSGLPTSSIT